MAKSKIKSIEYKDSRYIQGGLTVGTSKDYLGWWERDYIPPSDDDISFVITSDYARRPDLVSAAVYGNSTLMWLVLQYNNILDVNVEFVEGKVLQLPTQARVITSILYRPKNSTL